IENPRVDGSIPSQATRIQPQEIARFLGLFLLWAFSWWSRPFGTAMGRARRYCASRDKIAPVQGLACGRAIVAALHQTCLFVFRSWAFLRTLLRHGNAATGAEPFARRLTV
ncbi:MAG: hypothetical protein OSB38_01925, partial [Paraburkholderia fungorum]|nr:hypothetical protein [Paraburkholderia fungorum]